MAKKDKNDPETSVLFKEIDEELRQDKASALWKQYGPSFIGAIVLLIVAVAGFETWKYFDFESRSAMGERYHYGLTAFQNNQLDQATTVFEGLSEEGDKGYGLLAQFQQAAVLAEKGNLSEAAQSYFALSQNDALDETYQNMALLLGAMNGLGSMDGADIISRLDPLANGASAWRHSALELQAHAHAQNANLSKANEILNTLVNDATAPVGVRQRAGEFVEVYGGRTP